jgi:ferric-dicitrate binding protein FerR (iron transport regulator)
VSVGYAADAAQATPARPRQVTVTARRIVLAAIALVLFGLAMLDLGSWVQSGMGFIEHQGHLVDHLASLLTTGSWERSEPMALVRPSKYIW